MNKKSSKVSLTVIIDKDIKDKLDKIYLERGIIKYFIVEKALREYLEKIEHDSML